jgi:hypothetical protein
VDRTGSGSCPVAGFCTSGAEPCGSAMQFLQAGMPNAPSVDELIWI